MNYLVETKIEYTSQLTNLLTPLIYEGISSLYDDAIKVAKENEELQIFQSFLKKIPKWNASLLENETNRIITTSGCNNLIKDLINAVIKANIMILTNTPPEQKHNLNITTKIELSVFIHNCYIETARIIYNNPYLFYHKYSLYDVKRNQRESYNSIHVAIIEAIRKMLPLKLILQEYLGNSFNDKNPEQDFDHTITENERNKLNNMINADITKKSDVQPAILKSDVQPSLLKSDIQKSDIKEVPPSLLKSDAQKSDNQSFVLVNKNKLPNKIVHDEEDSVAYYKKPNIEDTFSNNANIRNSEAIKGGISNSPRNIFINKFSDSNNIIEMSNDIHNNSIEQRINSREKKNIPKNYKL